MKNGGIKGNKKLRVAAVCAGVVFAGLSFVAASKKKKSVFDDRPEQKNPFEGKRVVFIRDDGDKENADGICGHLEVVENDEQQATMQSELQSGTDAVQSASVAQQSNTYDTYVKRGLDIALSFGGLVLLAPIYAAIALAIKIEDPGPVLFTQKRVGRNKQYFELHKFRSMKVSTPHDVPTHMLDNPDQYITKVGKFLRAHSLDELPQIWDIFIGNMSVVGPRPALWNQDVLTAERDKYGANGLRPGLTGWAQINGRDELELEEKAKLDGEYVKKESLLFDTKCFLGTICKIGHDTSVVEGGTGTVAKIGRHYTDGETDAELICQIGLGDEVHLESYSALMTVYKKEKPDFLEESVKCLFNQTVLPDEIVIVCDGPLTDSLNHSINLLKIESPVDFVIVRLKTNKGTGIATQVGLEACKNNLIMKLDSDDYCIRDRAKIQLSEFARDPHLSVCGSFMSEFRADPSNVVHVREVPLNHEDIAQFSRRRSPMNNITVMYKKKDVLSAGGYSSLRRCQDYELFARMVHMGYRMKNLPVVLSSARLNDDNLTRRGSKTTTQGFIYVHWVLYKQGVSSLFDFLLTSFAQIGYSVAPTFLRDYVYRQVFRNRKIN